MSERRRRRGPPVVVALVMVALFVACGLPLLLLGQPITGMILLCTAGGWGVIGWRQR